MFHLQSYDTQLTVLPRPSSTTSPNDNTTTPITGPPESAFTATFGQLLPPAQYINTNKGRFAYYDLPPSSPSTTTTTTSTPHRVLLIHGIQTPALGLCPLTTHLRKGFPDVHFLLYDLWGHGLSDTPRSPHVRELFLEQVDTLLDHVGWKYGVHMAGYSLGSTIVAGYISSDGEKGQERRDRVESYVYIAPAGLFNLTTFERDADKVIEQERNIQGGRGEESEWQARRWIVDFLEGGELVWPEGSEGRIARGEVVAEAVKWWEMKYHEGHAASVVSIVREGNVMDREETFRSATEAGKKGFAVLGEGDGLNSEEKVRNVGVEDVVVVKNVGHDVVRSEAGKVAAAIGRFWRGIGVKSAPESCDM